MQLAAQSLKGRNGALQSAASIGFQPGVGVDYPGYEPVCFLCVLLNREP